MVWQKIFCGSSVIEMECGVDVWQTAQSSAEAEHIGAMATMTLPYRNTLLPLFILSEGGGQAHPPRVAASTGMSCCAGA